MIEPLTDEIQKLDQTIVERAISGGDPDTDEYFQRELLHSADDLRRAEEYHPA
jgi:hypothetical protein